MPAKSLFSLAKINLQRHVKYIEGFGGIDYEYVRDIVAKVENPGQLHTIEQNNPEYRTKDGHVWKRLLERDVSTYKDNPVEPADGEDWYGLYQTLLEEDKKSKAASAQKLKARFSQFKAAKDQNVTHFENRNVVPEKSRKLGSKPVALQNSKRDSGYLAPPAGSKRAPKTGHQLIEKIRKETQEDRKLRNQGQPFRLDPVAGQKRKAPAPNEAPKPTNPKRALTRPPQPNPPPRPTFRATNASTSAGTYSSSNYGGYIGTSSGTNPRTDARRNVMGTPAPITLDPTTPKARRQVESKESHNTLRPPTNHKDKNEKEVPRDADVGTPPPHLQSKNLSQQRSGNKNRSRGPP